MPAPYDYGVTPLDPFASVISGLKFGAGIADIQAAQQERQFQQEQRAQALRQAEMVRAEGAKLLANPNPSARDFINYSLLLPKDQAESVRQSFDMLNKDKQQSELKFGGQVLSALAANQAPEAVNLLRQRADAERNSGNPAQAKVYEDSARFIELDPTTGFATIGTYLAVLPGGEKIVENSIKVGRAPVDLREAEAKADKARLDAITAGVDANFAAAKAQAALNKAQAEAIKAASEAAFSDQLNRLNVLKETANINNLNSQISNRAAQLKLDAQNIQSQIVERYAKIQEMANAVPAGLQPEMNKAFVAAAAAKGQEEQFNSLANRITNIGNAWGKLDSFTEWYKKSTGSENAVSELRQEYNRLRNSAAIQSLPPGPATDRDIQLALAGFPSETGNPQIIASFLRGIAKMKAVESAVEGARGEWMANNKGLLTRATRDFVAGDFSARAGESFADLTKRIADQVSKRYLPPEQAQAQQTERLVSQIPGAAPAPAPRQQMPPGAVDIMNLADQIIRGQR